MITTRLPPAAMAIARPWSSASSASTRAESSATCFSSSAQLIAGRQPHPLDRLDQPGRGAGRGLLGLLAALADRLAGALAALGDRLAGPRPRRVTSSSSSWARSPASVVAAKVRSIASRRLSETPLGAPLPPLSPEPSTAGSLVRITSAQRARPPSTQRPDRRRRGPHRGPGAGDDARPGADGPAEDEQPRPRPLGLLGGEGGRRRADRPVDRDRRPQRGARPRRPRRARV